MVDQIGSGLFALILVNMGGIVLALLVGDTHAALMFLLGMLAAAAALAALDRLAGLS